MNTSVDPAMSTLSDAGSGQVRWMRKVMEVPSPPMHGVASSELGGQGWVGQHSGGVNLLLSTYTAPFSPPPPDVTTSAHLHLSDSAEATPMVTSTMSGVAGAQAWWTRRRLVRCRGDSCSSRTVEARRQCRRLGTVDPR